MTTRPLALLLALALAGCAGGAPAADPTIAARATRNGVMDHTTRTFRMAAEQYAVDHDGRYPAPDQVLPDLVAANFYLPGNRMPAEPFTGAATRLVIAERPDLAALARPVAGAEVPAWLADPDGRRPGSLVYVVSRDRADYLLLGIGEAGGRPVVAAAMTTLPDARTGR